MNTIMERYLTLFPKDRGVDSQELRKIEKILEVNFPQDFKKITMFYSGGNIGGLSLFNFNANFEDDYSIVFKNLSYRKKINLPKNFLVLYDEYGFILLNTEKAKNGVGEVLDIAPTDIFNLTNGKLLQSKHKIYKSFTDFFGYLLDQEEEEREDNVE